MTNLVSLSVDFENSEVYTNHLKMTNLSYRISMSENRFTFAEVSHPSIGANFVSSGVYTQVAEIYFEIRQHVIKDEITTSI